MTNNDLGNVFSSLLSGDRREVKFEITCKMVDEAGETVSEKVSEHTAEPPAFIFDDEDIPRPLSKKGRINGIAALASFLDCAVSTAQKLKNENRVPYYARGCRIYFYKDEVADAMKQSPVRKKTMAVPIVE